MKTKERSSQKQEKTCDFFVMCKIPKSWKGRRVKQYRMKRIHYNINGLENHLMTQSRS